MATLDNLIRHLTSLRQEAGKDVPLYLVDNDFIPKTKVGFQKYFKLGQPYSDKTYDPDPHAPRGLLIMTGSFNG